MEKSKLKICETFLVCVTVLFLTIALLMVNDYFTDNFICPMEYKTQEYLEDLAKYISKEVRKAPQITLEELTVKRNKLMTEHKCEAFRLQGTHVTWYGTPTKISLSGDFRFNRTDERGNLINSDHWFWALVSDLHDKNKIDSIYNLLQERPEAAYRIVGRRDLNDCDYYPEDNPLIGTCIEVMVIDSIDLINP